MVRLPINLLPKDLIHLNPLLFVCHFSKEKDPDVMFIGDCILETLQFTEIWNQFFAPMHCLNFSIHNDRVENVLWRIENGELDNVNPKVGPG